MSILNRIWLSNISENLASISLESLFPKEENNRVNVSIFGGEGSDKTPRHVVHLGKFSDIDLYRIKVEIEKYLYERDKR